MHWPIYIFGSGLAIFLGVAFLLIAIVPSIAGAKFVRARSLLALIGMIIVALSAVPLPLWAQMTTGLLLLAWLFSVRGKSVACRRANAAVAILAFIALVAVIGNELRYQFPPRLQLASRGHIDLFGDSLAAGIGDPADRNWPELLKKSLGIELTNHASPGAKVSTALRQAQAQQLTDGVVLLEIGGNDLLDGASVADFERDLNHLLAEVSGPGRQVVMIELPLPPFHHGYGVVQRRLAARYGVRLIPKRVLMGILATQGATIDSLHLSPAGHEQLGEVLSRELKPAFASGR